MKTTRRGFIGGATSLLATGALIGAPKGQSRKVIEIAGIIEPTVTETTRAQYIWIQNAIDQFQSEYPDFEVRYQVYNGSNIDVTIDRDNRTGIKHDVVMVSTGGMTAHAEQGSLLDLAPFYDAWPEADRNDLDWLRSLQGDTFLFTPAVIHARAISYRKDLAEAAGLDFVGAPPQSLDELVEYAAKLTAGDVWGLGMYMGNHRATAELYFAPYLWARDSDVIDDGRMAIYANEHGVATAQFLSDLVNKHKVTPQFTVSGNYPDAISTGVLNGTYALAEGFGNYMFANLAASEYADKVGLFIPPIRKRFLNYWGLGISANTDYPEESARLHYLLMLGENLLHFDYGLPVRQSAYENDRYKSDLYAVMRESASTSRTFLPTANYNPLTESIAAAVQEVVISNSDPAPILQRYQDEYNENYGGA